MTELREGPTLWPEAEDYGGREGNQAHCGKWLSPIPLSLKGLEAQGGRITSVKAHSSSGEPGLGLRLSNTKAQAAALRDACGLRQAGGGGRGRRPDFSTTWEGGLSCSPDFAGGKCAPQTSDAIREREFGGPPAFHQPEALAGVCLRVQLGLTLGMELG